LASRLPEGEHSRLRTGVGVQFQRLVAIPINVKASGHPQNAAYTIRPTSIAGSVILRRIPGCRSAATLRVHRYSSHIALGGGRDAIPPILGNLRDPVACDIERRRAARIGRPGLCSAGRRTLR
jgi:hypothetical protein